MLPGGEVVMLVLNNWYRGRCKCRTKRTVSLAAAAADALAIAIFYSIFHCHFMVPPPQYSTYNTYDIDSDGVNSLLVRWLLVVVVCHKCMTPS